MRATFNEGIIEKIVVDPNLYELMQYFLKDLKGNLFYKGRLVLPKSSTLIF